LPLESTTLGTNPERKETNSRDREALDNKVTLFWNQRKCKQTAHLGKADNVATFSLADGSERSTAFCAEAEVDYNNKQVNPFICLPAQMVSDNDKSDDELENEEYGTEDTSAHKAGRSSNEKNADEWINTVDFELDGPTGKSTPMIIEDEEDVQPANLAAEMLWFHHKF
jgi:hypothetical protein